MGRPAIEGDSPVGDKTLACWMEILSTTGLE